MNRLRSRASLPLSASRALLLPGLLLAAAIGLTACPKTGGGNTLADCSPLAGIWSEAQDIGQTTTIQCVGGKPQVVSVIDSDGEVFVVRRSGVEGGLFTWDYNVPSTGYEVHIQVDKQEGDTLFTAWRNESAEGNETLYRQK